MLCRYIVKTESPLITPLMSDTFFGHFCWAVRYREGESFLEDFLNSYSEGKTAPLLFSSAFPSGCLPRPTLPAPSRKLLKTFVSEHFKDVFEGVSTLKKWSKKKWISLSQWQQLRENYSDLNLYEIFLESDTDKDDYAVATEIAASNTINRLSGTVPEEGGGGLFHRVKSWFQHPFDLYAEINDSQIRDMADWFLTEYLPQNGFGADKSVGMGCLSIQRDTNFDEQIFSLENANARLSLSLASFPGIGGYKAFYRLKSKFGKLGGNFAFSSPTDGNPRPFKKPILMYEPGAVFFCPEALNTKSLLSHVHSDERIRHCGIPLTLPFFIEESYHART